MANEPEQPQPSDEARDARQEAHEAVDRAVESHNEALSKMAEAAAAVARIVDHGRANDFVLMFRKAMQEQRTRGQRGGRG